VWNWLRPEIPGGDWAASIARSFITVGAMLLFVFLALPAHAEKGQSSYKQGREMEARQNYEGAYASYQRAYDADPRNTRFRAGLTRIRSLAAASKVHRALMEVSRDKVRTLGISPPTSGSVQLQANISGSSGTMSGGSTNGSNSPSSSSNSSSSSGNGVNLNSLAKLNATDFAATISSANATALFTDSSTKIIQNPQIRSLNGQKASLKIGQRVPTATGSFQSGISGLAVSGLVNTQFQYIDVGVNVDITPHVYPDGDVTLKIALDVSSVINNQAIGGIDEPVIGQRNVEHEIRLKDGEVSLFGGMLQQQDAQSLTGIPGLSQIPILKYLFSQTNTEVMDSEIVFAVIPHIVRRKDLNEFNGRTLDVGTANSIHLRHAPGTIPNLESDNGSEIIPPAKSSGETSAALEFDPTAISVAEGGTFTLDVVLSGAQDVYSVPLQIAYDKQGLQLLNISSGNFLSQGEQVVALVIGRIPLAVPSKSLLLAHLNRKGYRVTAL
jgi:general secretion pathway protein D